MGFLSLFRKTVGKSESVNEASALDIDTSSDRHTSRNVISDIFQGPYGGVRIPSAIKEGYPIPYWGKEYRSYPFFGINGFSDTVAAQSQKGKETGYMKNTLKAWRSDSVVNSILEKQVANGTGIPKNAFVFFPYTNIYNVGTGLTGNSESIFTQKISRKSLRQGLKDYAIQQALNVNENGELYPDENKNGGIVFMPKDIGASKAANSAGSSSRRVLRVVKLTDEMLEGVMERTGGLAKLAEIMTGSADMKFPHVNGLLNVFRQGERSAIEHKKSNLPFIHPLANDVPNGNPNFGKFFDFIKKNIKLEKSDYNFDSIGLKVREWILTNDMRTVCDRLVKPYLMRSPFDMTYCMVEPTDADFENTEMRNAYAVYQKCLETNQITESVDSITEKDESTYINEAEEGTIENTPIRDMIMTICREYSSSGKNIFVFSPRVRKIPVTRDDGKIVTKSEGTKRIFARVIYRGNAAEGLDMEFTRLYGESFDSHPFKFDYTELFKRFGGILDNTAKQVFNCMRISGYMVTFDYDEKLEAEFNRKYPGKREKDSYSAALLDFYYKFGEKHLREPVVFKLNYFIDEDFISYGYEQLGGQEITDMSSSKIPTSLIPDDEDKSRRGRKVNGGRLYSEIVYDNKAVSYNYDYNQQSKRGIL